MQNNYVSFKDYLTETKLHEMQFDKDKVETNITNFRKRILEHLSKAVKYRTNQDTRKHIVDVYDKWLFIIAGYEINNNIKLNKQQYMKLLSMPKQEFLDKILTQKFKKKYRDEYIEVRTDEDTTDIVLRMIEDICNMLQSKGKGDY